MSDIIPFQYEGKSVRVLRGEDGEPWWVAVDVCKALGIANARDALTKLDDDEKTQVVDPATVGIADGTGINNLLNLINEPGLYRLILTSRKPEAKVFKRWVTHEVLPQIRKTGKYALPKASQPTQGAALKLPKGVTWAKLASAHRAFFRMADDAGFRGPERIAAVHRAVVRTCGVDISGIFAPLTGQPTANPADEAPTALAERIGDHPADEVRPALSSAEPATVEVVVPPDAELRPTDLGGLLGGLTAQRMNQMLYAMGYQTPQNVRGQPDWKATAKGAPFAVQKYVSKANGIGGSVPQLFWKANILKDLRPATDLRPAGFQRASDDKGGQVPLLNS